MTHWTKFKVLLRKPFTPLPPRFSRFSSCVPLTCNHILPQCQTLQPPDRKKTRWLKLTSEGIKMLSNNNKQTKKTPARTVHWGVAQRRQACWGRCRINISFRLFFFFFAALHDLFQLCCCLLMRAGIGHGSHLIVSCCGAHSNPRRMQIDVFLFSFNCENKRHEVEQCENIVKISSMIQTSATCTFKVHDIGFKTVQKRTKSFYKQSKKTKTWRTSLFTELIVSKHITSDFQTNCWLTSNSTSSSPGWDTLCFEWNQLSCPETTR